MNTLLRILSEWEPETGEVIHIHAFKSDFQYSVSLKIKYKNQMIVLGFYINVDILVDSIVQIYNTLNSELEKNIYVNNKITLHEEI